MMKRAEYPELDFPNEWTVGLEVEVLDGTDDPQWPENFGTTRGVVVDTLGKRSRWVVVEVTESELIDAVGSRIRFPKAGLCLPMQDD